MAGIEGGGFYDNVQDGQTEIIDSIVSGNTLVSSGRNDGGGISQYLFTGSATLLISGTTISDNHAPNSNGEGGGLFLCIKDEASTASLLSVTVVNSTISSNSSGARGGGAFIGNLNEGNAQLDAAFRNVTLVENQSPNGGGLFSQTKATVKTILLNSIVSGNLDMAMVANNIGGTVDNATSSFNLVGTGGNGGLTVSTANGNILNEDDPKLLPLGNYGGPTPTHKPQSSGSPVVDAGNPAHAANTGGVPEFDQRGPGFGRVGDGDGDTRARIDIGAVELEPIAESAEHQEDNQADPNEYELSRDIRAGNSLRTEFSR